MKRFITLICFFLSISVFGNSIFAESSYKANDYAILNLVSDNKVSVKREENYIIFSPKFYIKNKNISETFGTNKKFGIVFYPGGKVEFESYAPLMKAFAEKGIVCILLKVRNDLAILDVLAAGSIENVRAKYDDVSNWFLAGHSLGGTGASLYLMGHKKKYDGIIFLGSYSSANFSATDKKFLLIRGSNDHVLNQLNYAKSLRLLPHDFREVIIDGGNHSGFGSYGIQNGDGQYEMPAADSQIKETADIVADFFNEL